MIQKEVHRLSVLRPLDVGKRKDSRWSCHVQPLREVVQGDNRKGFFPCSGNGNGQSWNNRGSNGNYWSSSLNSATNGRNLNFNSGGVNPQNNNNRFNGFAVRPVQHSILGILFFILTSSTHGADEKEAITRPLRGLLRCKKAQGNAKLCAPLGEKPKGEHGLAMRRSDEEMLQAFAIEMLYRRLSEEARDICSHVQGQDSAPSVFQLYPRSLRENLHTGLLQLHQGQGNTLRNRTSDGLLQEGESQLAAQVLCHAPGYSRILHAHSSQEAIADSHRLPAQDGYAQMPGREDVERCAGHGLPDMAYGNDSDAGPARELHHCGRQVELDWTGPCEEHAALGGRTGTPYWQPYVTAVLERLSKPIRPVCETRAEMQVLRTVCGRRHSSIARQGMAASAGSQDTALPKRNTWAGPSHGKAADKRGTSWYRVPGQLYQILQDVRVAQHPAAHREEDCLAGLLKATEDIAQCQLLPWYLPAYSLVQHQTQAVHERGIPENRCLRCRYD